MSHKTKPQLIKNNQYRVKIMDQTQGKTLTKKNALHHKLIRNIFMPFGYGQK